MDIVVDRVHRKNKSIILEATKFYSKELISPRLAKNVSVVISHSDELVADDMNGFCEWVITNIRPREFEISLNCKREMDEVLISLAHEMVHVAQFVSDRMQHRFKGGYKFIWEGQEINTEEYEYFDLPWEIEAYDLENVLYEKYKRSVVSL